MSRGWFARRIRARDRVALVALLVAAVLVPIPHSVFAPKPAAAAPTLPPGFSVDTMTATPYISEVAFAPDGRIFVSNLSGVIRIYHEWGDTSPTLFADLSNEVDSVGDRGMLSMKLDPQFPARPYLYVGYTYDAPPGQTAPVWHDDCPTPPGFTTDGCVVQNRVERLTVSGDTLTARKILVQDWCQQFPSHSIGGMAFGPDGALYVAAGEGASYDGPDYGQLGGSLSGTPTPVNPCADAPVPAGTRPSPPTAEGGALRAQDLVTPGDPQSLDGAVIRIDPDTGAALPDNPGAGSPDVNARRIVAYGFKNPYSLAFRPGTKELYIGDVGLGRYEEVDLQPDPTASIKNFGWPCYEGPLPQPIYQPIGLNICNQLYAGSLATAPYYAYSHTAPIVNGDGCPGQGGAITALSFYGDGNYPAQYHGALFFGDYVRSCIWAMLPGSNGRPDPSNIVPFAVPPGTSGLGIVNLEPGPGGDLVYVDLFAGTINRIRYTAGNAPPTAVATATPTAGPLPLHVAFDGTQSKDPEGDALTYAWDLDGDGAYDDSTSATPTWDYTQAANVTVRLKVTDSVGAVGTTSIHVTPGNSPPSITLTQPTPTFTWHVGESIPFAASAVDPENGTLPASAFHWTVVLHHCSLLGMCHLHPLQSIDGLKSGSISAPDHGYPAYLTLTVTVADSQGATTSKSVDIQPETSTLTLQSSPAGMQLSSPNQNSAAPFTETVITGSSNFVDAPGQAKGATAYGFDAWSDGGAQDHNVVVSAPTTLTASFSPRTLSIADTTVFEGTGGTKNVSIPVTLNHVNSEPVTVQWATTPASAQSPADFTAASGTLTFAPGTTTQNAVVTLVNDATPEPTETFTIALTNPGKATLTKSSAVVSIADDDSGPPTLTPQLGTALEGASGTSVLRVPFGLNRPTAATVTAAWSTGDLTATAGSDYVAASGTLSIPPGQTVGYVDVTIKGDTVDENDEHFVVNASQVTNATLGGYGAGYGKIVDDDGPPGAPALIGGLATTVEGDSGTHTVSVPVSLTKASAQAVSADWSTVDDTAVSASDYTAQSGSVHFNPGQTSATITVTVRGDTLDEQDEVFRLAFSNIVGASLGGYGSAFAKIIDDDGPPGSAKVVGGVGSVTEGNSGTTTLTVPVSLSAVSTSTITADWRTVDYQAVAPGDYVAASGKITFPPGSTSASINVTVKGDTIREPNELLVIEFSNVTNAGLGGLKAAFGLINNDDP